MVQLRSTDNSTRILLANVILNERQQIVTSTGETSVPVIRTFGPCLQQEIKNANFLLKSIEIEMVEFNPLICPAGIADKLIY